MLNLSIIIVSWNVKEKLRDNLLACRSALKGVSAEIFVIDNDSQDGTVAMIKQDFPEIILIANQENVGFAKANNQALKLAQGQYLLLLNPDMQPEINTFSNILKWLEINPQASITGCKLIDQTGKLVKHVRRFPGIFDQLMVILKIPHFMPSVLNKYLVNDFNYDQAAKVDSIRGAFFVIRREAFKRIGLLDERYFIWFEEVDYCKKAQQAGLEVWYTPAATCLDYVGQSFKQVKRGTTQKYFRESMLKYFSKWHSKQQVLIIKIAWVISDFFMKILSKLK